MTERLRGLLTARDRLHRSIRAFMHERGILEVTTPVLAPAGNPDPNIAGFTSVDGPRALWLRTSPEFWHKRLLAAGAPDCYEMGPVFRRGEAGRLHAPEFTLLEWYRRGLNDRELAGEVVALIRHAAGEACANWPVETATYRELFRTHLGLDPLTCPETDLKIACSERQFNHAADRDEALQFLLATAVEPHLAGDRITVVHDFPASQAALARLDPDLDPGDPAVARRFEVYLGKVELANGYWELTDPEEQRRRFERENRIRASRGLPCVPMDEDFLQALEAGLPDCAGVALGVDRLLMVSLGMDRLPGIGLGTT